MKKVVEGKEREGEAEDRSMTGAGQAGALIPAGAQEAVVEDITEGTKGLGTRYLMRARVRRREAGRVLRRSAPPAPRPLP